MKAWAGTRWVGWLTVLIFWLAVGFTNYPAPFIDDLSYIGAAINLAQHGLYSNPYCEMLSIVGSGPGHLFLDYMPMENYLLAGWFKVFGISTASVHVLFTFLAFAASLALLCFLPRLRRPGWASLVICLAVYGLLGGTGLRADAFGIVFFLLGCRAWRASTLTAWLTGNLYLALVVITFPNLAFLAMATSLAALFRKRFIENRSWRQLVPFALAMGAAYAVCFGVFLICIQGHLIEFLVSTAKNQQLSAMGVRDRFQFFTALGISKWLVTQMAFLVLSLCFFSSWRKDPARKEEVFFLAFSWVGFVLLGYSSLNSATGAHVWAFACLMTALILLLRERTALQVWSLYFAIFAIASFGHYHVALQHLLAQPKPPPDRLEELRAELEQARPPRLYVDVYALRELYDYRLPPNARAFETCTTGGWGIPTKIGDLPRNAVFVVSVADAMPTPRNPDAGKRALPFRIFGVRVPGVIANPYELEIIDTRE